MRWMRGSPRTEYARRTTSIYKWREQAIIEWSWHVISIVACCHSAKLCAHAAGTFWSQQNGAVTRMWRSCQVQPSHKEHAIGVVCCKKEGMLLQPLRWLCVECLVDHERYVCEEQHHMWFKQAIIECSHCVSSIVACVALNASVHHARNVHEDQHHIYEAQTSNKKSDLVWWRLLPQCEALCTCCLGFPMTAVLLLVQRKFPHMIFILIRIISENWSNSAEKCFCLLTEYTNAGNSYSCTVTYSNWWVMILLRQTEENANT